MKSTFSRMVWIAGLALAVLAFAGCGGHDRDRGGSSDSGNGSETNAPAFDPTGAWATSMDSTALGTTSFTMDKHGKLSGEMTTDSGDIGSIEGTLAGTEAEYTVKFQSRAYLVSLMFNSLHTSGTGKMVDADGHSHSLKLSKK